MHAPVAEQAAEGGSGQLSGQALVLQLPVLRAAVRRSQEERRRLHDVGRCSQKP